MIGSEILIYFSKLFVKVNSERHENKDLPIPQRHRLQENQKIRDQGAEKSRRKHLAQFALAKYRKIWENKFISARRKIRIYNVYVRSILLYNCWTLRNNLTISKNLDAFHRKLLRKILGINYPKIVKIDRLYAITKEISIAEHIETRWKAHFGHILRRNYPIRRIFYNIKKLPPKGRAKANILKTYSQIYLLTISRRG